MYTKIMVAVDGSASSKLALDEGLKVAKASGARLVARTLHTSVGLPWHRILGAGGEIEQRGDHALEQRLRLESEHVIFRGRRVDMKRHEHKFGRKSPP